MADSLTLTPDSVHVWSATLEVAPGRLDALFALLSANERERVARISHLPTRQQTIVAYGTLRILLGRYLGRAPARLQLTTRGNGKPVLLTDELHFNLSHSGGLAVFAITARCAVGVDVEQLNAKPAHLDIADRFFAAGEVAAIPALAPARREEAFYHVWTRKEAFIKAVGVGLSFGLDRFEVSVPPDDPPRFRHLDGDPRAAAAWSLISLTPAQGYVAALAIEGPMPNVELRSLDESGKE